MSKIDWNAVSAIGQWVGAAGTIGAVTLALKQSKPSLQIKKSIGVRENENELCVTVVNAGYIPVNILLVGYKTPNKPKGGIFLINSNNSLPKALMPGETFSLYTSEFCHKFSEIMKYDSAIVIDTLGKTYYEKTNYKGKIKRWYWLKYGKYDLRR